jgi:outer membrane lipoprotein-sorting protein
MKYALPVLLGLLSLSMPAAHAEEVTIEELLNATDDVTRGESSVATITMNVKTSRYERSVTMKAWSKGTEKSLIQILEPAKEKGTSTLKVEDNIWNYLPKVDRTIKVPASMMSGSWMGSHFSNDDLVKENRLAEEFTGEITQRPEEGDAEGIYKIELTPKPDAAVVWGKVLVQVRADRIPVDIQYYDEKGELVRTMTFDDVRDIDGHMVPARMKVLPADKPDEYTEIVYQELQFDVDIPDSTFSLQALRK